MSVLALYVTFTQNIIEHSSTPSLPHQFVDTVPASTYAIFKLALSGDLKAAEGSTVDSIVDSILESLPVDLANLTIPNVDMVGTVQITKLGNVSRACPMTVNETMDSKLLSFAFSTCVNLTDVVVTLTDRSVKVSIAEARFDLHAHFTKSVKPAPKVTLTIGVWKGIDVKGNIVLVIIIKPIVSNRNIVQGIFQSAIDSALQKIDWQKY
uniref:BPI2 domain-containing protein n=1 Tax=Mesocestoides corti TaxID=53468 RepID=A0A5K3FKI6_MESCO